MNGMIRPDDVIEITDSSEDDDYDDEDKRTIFCRNLHGNVTETILYELFLQGGPIESVSIPKESNGSQKTYGFIKFKHKSSVPYCLKLFDNVKLFGQTIYLNTRQRNFCSLTQKLPTTSSAYNSQGYLLNAISSRAAAAATAAATTAAATIARLSHMPPVPPLPPIPPGSLTLTSLPYNQRVFNHEYFARFSTFVNNVNNLYLCLPPNV